MSATSSSGSQHDDQSAPPRAATQALQERFKIRQVTLQRESANQRRNGRR
jgi:hypothetical protein